MAGGAQPGSRVGIQKDIDRSRERTRSGGTDAFLDEGAGSRRAVRIFASVVVGVNTMAGGLPVRIFTDIATRRYGIKGGGEANHVEYGSGALVVCDHDVMSGFDRRRGHVKHERRG